MTKFGIIVDKDGYRIRLVYMNKNDEIQEDKLEDGEQLITIEWSVANSMNKPKWDFENEIWIDTEPIEVIPQESEPNKIDILKENKQLWDTVQFLLKESGYIPSETE